MLEVTVKVEGKEELLASFAKVRQGILDLRQLGAWKAVAGVFRRIVKEAFASEGASGKSGRWKALSSPYKERKLKKWGDVPILQASGKMYRSLTQEGAENSVYQEDALELTIGTSDPKAGYHQRGGSRLPKREPVSFTPDQESQLAQPIQQKLKQLIANAKLADIRGF